ncbi:MAG: PHP domain-containing protein [Lachnospiraceae bacterium]|nr:PHP domain-containing protein [Lachnospiraceae bacterium]
MFEKIDLHMHSTFSDGTDTPEILLNNVKSMGVGMFALTDHDAYAGCIEMRKYLKDGDPLFINGVEFSTEDEKGKYHVVGLGFDLDSKYMKEMTETFHQIRVSKARNRINFLRSELGLKITEEDEKWILSQNNPGKPHIGRVLVDNGYALNISDAIQQYVIRYKEVERKMTPEEAIDTILRSGGIPVLAHVPFGDGGQDLTDEEVENRVVRFKKLGLLGVEGFYSDYSKHDSELMLSLASKYSLYVSAASDYHGKNKKIGIGEVGPYDTEKQHYLLEPLINELAGRKG